MTAAVVFIHASVTVGRYIHVARVVKWSIELATWLGSNDHDLLRGT